MARAIALATGRREPLLALRRPRLPSLEGLVEGFAGLLTREIDDRRGFLFLPVAVAAGAALYFGAPNEPLPYAAPLSAVVLAALAMAARARPFAFHVLALLAALAAGFALASIQVQRMAHPLLATPMAGVEIAGFVEVAEQRARGSRITLALTRFGREARADEGGRVGARGRVGLPREGPERLSFVQPTRVRVTLATREPPAVGAHVRLLANLAPPPGPAYPGGFDFGRAIWFDGIGATGFALGKAQPSPPPSAAPLALSFAAWLGATRQSIAARIRAVLSGAEAGIAVALVTGLRDAVPEAVEESMRVAGLSHILSISGLHMALVATTVFFLVRALLALVPELALRYPIKAWAALPAALAATYYLMLSGAEVPTQRSYVTTLIVLAGVALGRPALTLRTLALAALAVMTLTPWAILDPGAQMSFAATLALIAAYERWGHLVAAPAASTPAGRWLGLPVRYVAALVLTSLAAGLATAPFAAFHFQRLAPLSLLANLAAMPVVSFIVMPAGLGGALLLPFGWDPPAWILMGWGIQMMDAIADWVAAMPGADRGIPAMPLASLGLLSLSLALGCLLRTRLVLVVPALAGAALIAYAAAPHPDVLIDRDGRTVAVRGADGRLAIMGDRDAGVARRFAVEQWLSAEGERGRAGAADLTARAACDPLGCTLPDARGDPVALSRNPASLEEDCRRAILLVTNQPPPADCAATVIRIDPRQSLAGHAVFRTAKGGWRLDGDAASGTRPWQVPSSAAQPAISLAVPMALSREEDPRSTGPGAANGAPPSFTATERAAALDRYLESPAGPDVDRTGDRLPADGPHGDKQATQQPAAERSPAPQSIAGKSSLEESSADESSADDSSAPGTNLE
ncbi:competence protein ComEC [Angulomicrobium tetraedrale]|uniref:Competence protein ComEC n=1 Tax=Ancylobacter tetraedralis TaxID=217068 RepID=A0A839ZGJ5_9HYPH|nr:ComEC/Rec2 family competence protein [Ancylobacter tetraedralis]MBB3773904.1 competence protein ComEC [Ancylobacter tetraedralis]